MKKKRWEEFLVRRLDRIELDGTRGLVGGVVQRDKGKKDGSCIIANT